MINKLIKSRSSIPISTRQENNPFLSIQTALDKAMDDFYKFFRTPIGSGNLEGLTITPAIDIIDEADRFKVEAEVPGMGPEDLKISITNDSLTISGEKTISKQDEGKGYQSREIAYGSYQRVIPLPDSVNIDKTKATFKKGMLWVEIPKKEGEIKKRKEIKIEEVKS